jgi:hypothetical protein
MKGRPIFLGPDSHAFKDVGPLFVNSRLYIHDNGSGVVISSKALGPTPLESGNHPGVLYCKLVSPARIMDYVMTDSLKPQMSCLNK